MSLLAESISAGSLLSLSLFLLRTQCTHAEEGGVNDAPRIHTCIERRQEGSWEKARKPQGAHARGKCVS